MVYKRQRAQVNKRMILATNEIVGGTFSCVNEGVPLRPLEMFSRKPIRIDRLLDEGHIDDQDENDAQVMDQDGGNIGNAVFGIQQTVEHRKKDEDPVFYPYWSSEETDHGAILGVKNKAGNSTAERSQLTFLWIDRIKWKRKRSNVEDRVGQTQGKIAR